MEEWVSLLPRDPRPWLLQADEPFARWVALTELYDRPADDPEVLSTRALVLKDQRTQALIARLPDWEMENDVSGHDSPRFAPNLLNLLADMGVQGGDDRRVDAVLAQMVRHQDAAGRFQSYGRSGHGNTGRLVEPVWGSLLCDAHSVAEVLVRFGVECGGALQRVLADRELTAQGEGWPCLPHTVSGFRGPGRKGDFCPMVTLEALRIFAWLPPAERPAGLTECARTALRAWRVRGEEKPYLFGHGLQFKVVKWPALWYGIYWVLSTLACYRELWGGQDALPEDRRAVAELAACMLAYNFNADGVVVPRSCYKGFEGLSFGQKKLPSPFATARLAVVLRRLSDLTEEIRKVDVLRLGSSKGGTGVPLAPKK